MTIRKHLLIPLALYSAAIAVLLVCNFGAIRILSAVRAFVFAEGLWSKAEKDAVLTLRHYAFSGDTPTYYRYQEHIETIASYSRARLELSKEEPDFQVADAGFIGGGSDPGEVRMMGYLFHYARGIPVIAAASQVWAEGDEKIAKLSKYGSELHQLVKTGRLNHEEQVRYFSKLSELNVELTELEKRFSAYLNQGASLVQAGIVWANFAVVLFFAGLAVLSGWRVSTAISKTLEAMVDQIKNVQAGEKNLRMNENSLGEFASLAVAFNDLLDSDARKEARLTEQMKFEVLVNALNRTAIVSVTDEAGYFVNVNDKVCEISGYQHAELIGAHLRLLSSGHHSEDYFDKMWAALKTGRVWSGELCRRARDGRIYWVDSSVTPIVDAEGQHRFLHIEYDITSRKLMEQQALQASKMVSLGEMAAGMAHEINNPSGIILLIARRLKRTLAAPSLDRGSATNDVEKIETATNRIVAIVKGLLDFAHDSGSEPFLPTSLRLICEQALSVCKARLDSSGISLTFGDQALAIHELEALADVKCEVRAAQIVQVLVSLLNNSIDAVERLPVKWIHIGLALDSDRRVRLSVTDSGRGISSEIVDKIMQPFFSTREIGKGTGLGLSISRGIIEAHGGTLQVDKNSTHTCFVIELPFKQNEARAAA